MRTIELKEEEVVFCVCRGGCFSIDFRRRESFTYVRSDRKRSANCMSPAWMVTRLA